MLRRHQNVRIYVRNKARYNPESREREFLFVDIADFAGTTIGDVKEDVKRQCSNALKIDELFLNNQPLADDRSVAHYNLVDGSILESTSNPFWVACLYIKASEIRQQLEGNPTDNDIQSWTQKSLPKKYTLIGLLLNSKNEYVSQPPYFPTLQDFVQYLVDLSKKGATMHPNFTQRDMRALEREYREDFVGRYDDPIAVFVDHYAVQLGFLDPDDGAPRQLGQPNPPARGNVNQAVMQPRAGTKKKQERHCEDCEQVVAEVFCTDCQGGIALCRRCSAVLHTGATRRQHNLTDIGQAPKNNKPYVPRAFLAPFSLVLAMYSALTEGRLSLTEDEIKRAAQPLTDTDLQDKQAGKYVGGFDCMENVLMAKGLVKKEAARIPTYALTEPGHTLGERLYIFNTAYYRYLQSCRLPKVHNSFRATILDNRKLCLLVDENERDKGRLLRYAREKQIDVQTRLLPAGDYLWILTPPMMDPRLQYTGKDYQNELVLPFVVERKSWEDLEHSTHTARFQRQVNNMLGSGIKNCFYLMEGSVSGLKNNPTHHHQLTLKAQLEKLTSEYGFYVNYTTSWMKSAQWLLWFTGIIMEGLNKGLYQTDSISYTEYMSKVARQRGAESANIEFRASRKHSHRWNAAQFIDNIFRDSLKERPMLTTVQQDLALLGNMDRHLVLIQGLEQYNKKRQSTLNKCCTAVHNSPDQAREIVNGQIGQAIQNMVHYDTSSYWQLYIQVMTGVYVVRTETDQDTDRIQHRYMAGPKGPPPTINTADKQTPKTVKKFPKALPDKVTTGVVDKLSRHIGRENIPPKGQGHRRGKVHTIGSLAANETDSDGYSQKNTEKGKERHIKNNHKGQGHLADVSMKTNDSAVSGYVQTIIPFSGEGQCLGRREKVNNLNDINRIVELGQKMDRLKQRETIPFNFKSNQRETTSTGLLGGMRVTSLEDSNMNDDTEFDTQSIGTDPLASGVGKLDANDFANSQNEEDIMNDVLGKSIQEVRPTSNEDEMYRLALEMSKTDSSVVKTTHTTHNLTEEEQFQKVLEMSKQDFSPIKVPKSETETEQLQRVMALSKIETKSPAKKHSNFSNDQNVKDIRGDQELQKVLEMSKRDVNLNKGTDNVASIQTVRDEEELVQFAIAESQKQFQYKTIVEDVKQDLIDIPDNENDQVELALEISRNESPQKCIGKGNYSNDSGIIQMQTTNHRKAVKRRMDRMNDADLLEIKKVDMKENQDLETEELTEEQQVQLAILLSKEEEKTSGQVVDDRSNLYIEEIIPRKKAMLQMDKLEQNERNCYSAEQVTNVCDVKKEENIVIEIDSQSQEVDEEIENIDMHLIYDKLNKISHYSGNNSKPVGPGYDDHNESNNIDNNENESDDIGNDDVAYSSEEDDIVQPSPTKVLSQSNRSLSGRGFGNLSFVSAITPNTSQNSDHRSSYDDTDKQTCDKITKDIKKRYPSENASKCSYQSDKLANNKDILVREENDENNQMKTEKKGFNLKANLFYESGESDEESESEDYSEVDIFDDQNKTNSESVNNALVESKVKRSLLQVNGNSDKNNTVEHRREQALIKNQNKRPIKTYSEANLISVKNENVDDKENFEEFDDDNDIDYQPNSQDLEDTDQDSQQSCADDKEDNDDGDDDSPAQFDYDDELLPLINRPRRKRYEELKKESDNMIKRKKLNTDEFNVKTEMHTETNRANRLNEHTCLQNMDEMLAQMLQQELNRENTVKAGNKPDIDDEYIAKELQKKFDNEVPNNASEIIPDNSVVNHPANTVIATFEADEALAKRLNEELNKNVDEDVINDLPNVDSRHEKNSTVDKTSRNIDGVIRVDNDDAYINGHSDAVVKELQKQELEKIERWRQTLINDATFARQLQEMENNEENAKSSSQVPAPSTSSASEPCFKVMVSKHKASRERAIAQLDEYRRLQMERFDNIRGGASITGVASSEHDRRLANNGGGPLTGGVASQSAKSSSLSSTMSHLDRVITIEDDEDQIRDVNTNPLDRNNAPNNFRPTQATIGYQPNPLNQSQNLSQVPGIHVGQIDLSQSSVGSHVTQSDQSQLQPIKNSNVTCGNCGEKGHNRTFIHCPRYHTAEETARRETKSEKLRQQKEEKKKQETETINMLSQHQHVLEEMTTQIQTEMNTIQARLRRRTSELESQVSSRVKKIENANKRNKKK